MGKLINEWVTESILTEDIKKTVVTYVGRFHPFHSGHYATYSHLVKKFGKDNVYIGTSDKVELPKSPFRFKEKVDIMSTMFGIPKNKIVQVKNPYGPKEILGKFDEDTTAFITVVGEKDKSRLGGKYFQPYKGEPTEGYRDRGYVYVAPSQSSPLSGTAVRKGMSDSDEKNRIKFFKKAYPKFNQKIFDLVSGRLIKVESVMESFLQTFDIKEMLSEASSLPTSGKGIVDDGPGAFYGNMKTFKKEAEDVTTALGWEIVSYLMDDDSMESFDTSYPNGPGRYQVSFFPSGDTMDGQSIRYGKDVTGRPGYRKWAKHIKKVALRLGMEFVKFAEPKDIENLTQNTGTEKQKDKVNKLKLKENVLNEGGAYGHMNHPFDVDLGLTFSDLKIIIDKALNGKLEFTREKTDGQALAISWRADRGLIAARNKSHLKDRGLNALDIKGVSDKFANRGGLTDAYNFAMKDLENAIKGLSKAQREKVFKDGSKFMNIEVIWPESVNVIPYGQPLLVFHGTMEYDESGVAIGADTSDGRILAGMIKQVNADVQSKYTIQGPPVVTLPKNQELSKMKSKFFGQLSKIQKEFSLKDSAGVAEYHQKWWESFVDKNSPTTLDNKQKMGLVKRWAFYDKGLRLDKKVFSDEKTLEWAKKIDKQDHAKISKENIRKFEDIFLGVGSEVLSFMSSVLTVNPDKAIRDMKKRLDKTIKDVQNSGDSKKINKLKMELERLAAVGGKDKLVPNEGLVFLYKGHTMKLTGTFASLNQILGLMYF
tara:strand:+ start:6019 stop:8313 length:2295 start_codon:yes stop_codon:yes gene_type:complete